MSFQDVKIAAQGRWHEIHKALGIFVPSVKHVKHTPCPACGGKDRFRVGKDYHRTGQWFCSQGGGTTGGDGFGLIGHVLGIDKGEQLKAVANYLHVEQTDNDRYKEQRNRYAREQRKQEYREAKERAQKAKTAADKARTMMTSPADPDHPYLRAKGLAVTYNLTQCGARLFVPAFSIDGELMGGQVIFGEPERWGKRSWGVGDKYLIKGTIKKASLHWLDYPPEARQPIAIVEGWATGASLYEPEINFKGAVAVAFDAGNVSVIAKELLIVYPDSKIHIYADDDPAGHKAANQCRRLSPDRVSVHLPKWFKRGGSRRGTDFNDYMISCRSR